MDFTFKLNNINLEFNNIKSVFNEKTIMKINETSQTVIQLRNDMFNTETRMENFVTE